MVKKRRLGCPSPPRLASPCLALPRLASPCLALPRLASPRLASPRLAALCMPYRRETAELQRPRLSHPALALVTTTQELQVVVQRAGARGVGLSHRSEQLLEQPQQRAVVDFLLILIIGPKGAGATAVTPNSFYRFHERSPRFQFKSPWIDVNDLVLDQVIGNSRRVGSSTGSPNRMAGSSTGTRNRSM